MKKFGGKNFGKRNIVEALADTIWFPLIAFK